MRLTVTVKAGASVDKVIQSDETTFRVYTKTLPEKGKANEKVIKLLAAFLHVPQNNLSIQFGKTAPEKIIEVTLPLP